MNNLFIVKPESFFYDEPSQFFKEISLNKEDVILTSKRFAKVYFFNKKIPATICLFDDYCQGEPTDKAIDQIKDTLDLKHIKRIVAIGGGSILDAAKFLALENKGKTSQLFDSTKQLIRKKELVLIPTTCGTGSEITKFAVCELTDAKTKKGLADNCLYADKAILVPKFLNSLPQEAYANSAIDALVHAIESFLSPNSTVISQDFAEFAIKKMIASFKLSLEKENGTDKQVFQLALLGSYYAGIAFTNTGVGTIHAMSYPFSTKYHVPHGESNYVFLFSVLEYYQKVSNSKSINSLQQIIGHQLDISSEQAIPCLKSLLHKILALKSMSEYGAKPEDLSIFARIVYQQQQRLLKNAPVLMSQSTIFDLYKDNLR